MKSLIFRRMAIGMMVAAQILIGCSKYSFEPTPHNINEEAAKHGYIVLKREKVEGKWKLSIFCKEEDKPNVWVDLNNNGQKEENEKVTSTNYKIKVEGQSRIITIYGKADGLACDYNSLIDLDVSHNTALDYLSCRSNKLTSLDVTKNTELINLDCAENQLTSLDISQNKKLYNLDYTANHITSLQISGVRERFQLRCYKNSLSKADMEKLIASLPHNPTGEFYGWFRPGEETNYKGDELKEKIRAKGWKPYHLEVGGWKVWE